VKHLFIPFASGCVHSVFECLMNGECVCILYIKSPVLWAFPHCIVSVVSIISQTFPKHSMPIQHATTLKKGSSPAFLKGKALEDKQINKC